VKIGNEMFHYLNIAIFKGIVVHFKLNRTFRVRLYEYSSFAFAFPERGVLSDAKFLA
jgi:hypothetical protein